MATSPTLFYSELAAGHAGPPIPQAKRAYFQARLRNRLFNFLLGKFIEEQKKGLTKAALARRIGKSDAQINRLLGAPSNLTLDTYSDLLLGICAEEPTPASEPLLNQSPRNFLDADWIRDEQTGGQPGRLDPKKLGTQEDRQVLGNSPKERQLLGAK